VYTRHPCGLPSSCQPAATFGKDDLKWSATIDDISIGGVGLILNRRFEKGTGLAIELPGNGKNGSYVVLAKVMNIQKHGDSAWLLGCKFVSELSEDEVRRLVPATYATPATPIVAEETPLPCDNTAFLHPVIANEPIILPVRLVIETADGKYIQCTIPDFVATNCSWPLASGTVGSLKGITCNGKRWKVRVKVLQCRAESGSWVLECKPTKNTPEANLVSALGELLSTR